jgi:hypothetical protein
MEIQSASLRGKIAPVGPVVFVTAEWTDDVPQFVLLKYELRGEPQEYGVRMDVDKRMLMEDLEEPELNARIRERSAEIWSIVVNEIGEKSHAQARN